MFAPEIKARDKNSLAVVVPTAEGVVLNSMAAGSQIGQRVGNRVQAYSLELRGELVASVVSTVPQPVRWALVLDREPHGVLAAGGDIWETYPAVISLTNLVGRDRFVILHDETVVLGAQGVGPSEVALNPIVIMFRQEIPLYFEQQHTGQQDGGIASLTKNALLLFMWAEPLDEFNVAVVEWQTRFNYIDV